MKLPIRYFSIPFFIFLSFNSAFALNQYITISTVTSLPLIINAIFNNFYLKSKLKFSKYIDLPLVLLVIYLMFISIFFYTDKTINYLTAYSYIFIFLYFSFKQIIQDMSFDWANKFNRIGIYLTTSFICVNFLINNLFSINIQEYIPRLREASAFYSFKILRAYGFSIEPTVLSGYLLAFGVLALYSSYLNKWKDRYLLSFLIAISIFLTFSAGLIASLLISLSIIYFIKFIKIRKIKIFKLNKNFLLSFIILSIFISLLLLSPIFSDITSKILFLDDIPGSGRGIKWLSIIERINQNNFLPYGLGNASLNNRQVVNWYLQLIYEGGFIAFFLIVFHVFSLYIYIDKSYLSPFTKFTFHVVLLALFIQLNVFSSFYYPYAFLFGLSIREISQSKKYSKN